VLRTCSWGGVLAPTRVEAKYIVCTSLLPGLRRHNGPLIFLLSNTTQTCCLI